MPVDYILFCTLDVDLDLNLNEVSDARYVSKDELEAMFADSSKLKPACCQGSKLTRPQQTASRPGSS